MDQRVTPNGVSDDHLSMQLDIDKLSINNDNMFQCMCVPGMHCTQHFATALEQMNYSMGAAAAMAAARPEFHVRMLEHGCDEMRSWTSDFGDDFRIVSVYAIDNSSLREQFDRRQQNIELAYGHSNKRVLYQFTKEPLVTLGAICQEGLESLRLRDGFFGQGLYFSACPVKANDYSTHTGNTVVVRVLLQCEVLLGKVMDHEIGRFNRDLLRAPQGFNSVSGLIRREPEFCVYDNNQVIVKRLIFYTYSNTRDEMEPCMRLPPNMAGKRIAYITQALSEFFSQLQATAGPPDSANHMATKKAISRLLKQQSTVDDFLAEVSILINVMSPGDLGNKLRAELARCQLPPPDEH